MSYEYDRYLSNHKSNVTEGYEWLCDNLPELIKDNYGHQICFAHDHSKFQSNEYEAYDAYFYGGNKSYEVVQNFKRAWLQHIHCNPHHWQHWVLINDDPNEGEVILDMPYNYIVEMICDWWAFSWVKGDLAEIFGWYEKHKDYMKLSDKTRYTVEHILMKIRDKLEEKQELGIEQ